MLTIAVSCAEDPQPSISGSQFGRQEICADLGRVADSLLKLSLWMMTSESPSFRNETFASYR